MIDDAFDISHLPQKRAARPIVPHRDLDRSPRHLKQTSGRPTASNKPAAAPPLQTNQRSPHSFKHTPPLQTNPPAHHHNPLYHLRHRHYHIWFVVVCVGLLLCSEVTCISIRHNVRPIALIPCCGTPTVYTSGRPTAFRMFAPSLDEAVNLPLVMPFLIFLYSALLVQT